MPKLPETKPAAEAAAAPEPVVVETAKPVVAAPELGKKELVEQAVERSGIKKRDAKPVIEAVLALLGEAVAEGRELNLKPLGKLRVTRSQERSNGKVFVCKLRQPDAAAAAARKPGQENAEEGEETSSDPLAETAADR
ncbi:HU family DNA-binding protein [Leisingera sp. ANG-M1]|uniref:HU family DNA-binding protein n=1 Tax=Leisingera sp. ANG-M1 TaxID=1577895 RepID=UPI000B16CF34|nr:HU family DNA-binding protein [Leisingera sp. ANG-M1]